MVVLVSILVYGNAVQNGFVLDDGPVVLRNPLVHSMDGLWRIFAEPYWPPPSQGGQYRPLGTMSFAIDWVASGGDPRWLHAANVLWHAGAALLVWFLALELLAPAAAAIAALLFAVHPVHVEAVSNVVGRLEPMAAVFVLGALLAHRRKSWWAAVLFGLGLLAKESAITFVGLAVAHDVLLAGHWRDALRAARARYAAYALTTVAYVAVLIAVFQERSFTYPAPTFIGASTWERLLTVATIVPHYVRLLLAPIHLSGDYYPQVIVLATGVTPAGILGFALAVALGVAVRRAWRPVPEAAFALVWIPIALAPVSNVFFPSVALAERTLYLASVGACLTLGALAQRVARERATLVIGITAAALALGAARTWTRTPVWRSDKSYVLTLLRDHPESYRAHLVAGRVLAAQGQFPAAAEYFETASRLFPRDFTGAHHAAGMAMRMGRFGRADSLLAVALQAAPGNALLLLTRADVRFGMKDDEGAVRIARDALAIAPDSIRGWVIIAAAARRAGDLVAADAALREAVERQPDQWQLRARYADLLLTRGDSAAARVHADSAVVQSHGAPHALALRERARSGTAARNDSLPAARIRS
jgi:tetratricopeptide (TPR) repeat protein